MPVVKLVMIGDVVGEPGLNVLEKLLPPLIRFQDAFIWRIL
jgi:calcineurin-like phosphoesterase